MKITSKTLTTASLVLIGSSVFAQSLPDAKKAIDAEQYQKAKSMLKNLTVTQPTKDENFFYLGWVYIKQNYPDSAKAQFDKGIAANPKSALNTVGLGAIDLIDNNAASASANFDKAMQLAGKDSKPYDYIGKAYILGKRPIAAKRTEAAIAVLEKAKTLSGKNPSKDAELFLALGDAYSASGDASKAYSAYADGEVLDPNSPLIKVAKAVLIKGAGNYPDAITGFQDALKVDPNFGPAYREIAETDLLIAGSDPKQAAVKNKEAVESYKKYLDLTDRSIESRFRYEDFLVYAHDWKTLEGEATDLLKVDSKDLRIYRYLSIAAHENGNDPAALEAMNTWLSKADPKRIIANDYLYQGREEIALKSDSLGLLSLKKALEIDTTQSELYGEIAKAYYAKAKYADAAVNYDLYIKKSRAHNLNDYLGMGRSYFYAFTDMQDAYAKTKIAPDTSYLVKADSAFSYVNQHAASPSQTAVITRARIADARESEDRVHNYKGYAKSYYENYITIFGANPPTSIASKKNLIESYVYLGFYYELVAKDDAKAAENFGKAYGLDPTNKQVTAFYARHPGTPPPTPTPGAGTPATPPKGN